MKFDIKEQDLIIKPYNQEGPIYIREQKGYFQQIRRTLSYLLITLFVALPFIRYNGAQAIYIDLAQQKLNIFAFTLFPNDLVILCLLFIFFAFLLPFLLLNPIKFIQDYV